MTIAVFVGALLLAMAMGIPIAFSLLASGVALMWHLDLFDAQILAQNVIGGADSFPLLAVPFFMLAGEIMNVGGLSRRIVDFALALVGHVKGGLGYVTIMAGCLLSALSGSAVADAAALTALLLPMMVKAGHDKARAGGLIAATGVIGPVIPPSIGLVIFGVAANVSISKLFLAAIVPGLLMAGRCGSPGLWLVRREKIVPPPRKPAAEIAAAFRKALWALMLPVIILVGLRMGVFTPTEAAVVAAVYALFVSTVIYREITWRDLYGIFVSAAKTSAIVMFLIAAAMVSAWLITVADLPGQGGGPAAALHGQPDPADDRDHGAGDGGGHGDGHDAHHPDPHARAHAHRQGRGHRPGVLRRAVHHQQLDRAGHAAGGHGAQRGGRRGEDIDGRRHARRRAFHDRGVRGHVPDGAVPMAGDGAGQVVPWLEKTHKETSA
jgi:tripartite ATP-independent transporter DctM subunit